VPTPEHWRAHVLRLRPDEDVSMRVLRQGRLLEVAIPAGAGDARSASSRSGLTLRSVPRVGAEVLAVDPGSVAGRAGLRRGDIITRMGSIASPTAGQVNSVLSDPSGGVVLAAVTRGDGHFVVVLMK
jgi:hypothetical protein